MSLTPLFLLVVHLDNTPELVQFPEEAANWRGQTEHLIVGQHLALLCEFISIFDALVYHKHDAYYAAGYQEPELNFVYDHLISPCP